MPDLTDLDRALQELAGAPAEVVARGPGRVNLIGEHVDYNDGVVLPFAIQLEARVAVRRRPDRLLRARSLQLGDVVEVTLDDGVAAGFGRYVLGVLRELEELGVAVPGLDLVVDSTVPVGSGLSSSAALETAVAVAVTELVGARLSPLDLAMVSHRAETRHVGAPVGVMDQVVSACSRAGSALLLDCRSMQVRHVPLLLDGHALLVVDTRVRHSNDDGAYANRRAACEEAARRLGVPALRDAQAAALDVLDAELLPAARHVVTEMARVDEAARALETSDLVALGRLMTASHVSLRDDFEVSCYELDVVVDAALDAGALGARLTGAGLGGSAIALVPDALVGRVRAAVRAACRRAGTPDPGLIRVTSAAGAGTLRR